MLRNHIGVYNAPQKLKKAWRNVPDSDFVFFNSEDIVMRNFERIREVQPSKLYLGCSLGVSTLYGCTRITITL